MKYKVDEYVYMGHWDSSRRWLNVMQECQFLGDAFYKLYKQLEQLDPGNQVFQDKKIAERLRVIKQQEIKAEAKKKQLAERRKKEREQAKAKKAIMDKLTHEEKLAFGLVKEKK